MQPLLSHLCDSPFPLPQGKGGVCPCELAGAWRFHCSAISALPIVLSLLIRDTEHLARVQRAAQGTASRLAIAQAQCEKPRDWGGHWDRRLQWTGLSLDWAVYNWVAVPMCNKTGVSQPSFNTRIPITNTSIMTGTHWPLVSSLRIIS